MAKLIFLLVLAFVTYVVAYPSPQDLIQSLPERVKRAPGPNPDPKHLHHYETVTRDRFGNSKYTHEDVIHPDSYDNFHNNFHHDHFGHHNHHSHYGGHGFLGGIFDYLG